MDLKKINIRKASGNFEQFSMGRLVSSLKKSGADEGVIRVIIEQLEREIYEGISTKEIYKLAFKILKSKNSVTASRYKLKQAIFALGPTGFPFERFIGSIFQNLGYQVEIGKIIKGKCVQHEVDILRIRNNIISMMECKFHSEQGRNCDVKIALYIHARFRDILSYKKKMNEKYNLTNTGWVVTNTRFTKDAIAYSNCVGLNLLSWDMPKDQGLKDLIDKTGLYPITVSSLLMKKEIQFLLSHGIVLCKELIDNEDLLEEIKISSHRKYRILNEMRAFSRKLN